MLRGKEAVRHVVKTIADNEVNDDDDHNNDGDKYDK
jgi:hypothetical protein